LISPATGGFVAARQKILADTTIWVFEEVELKRISTEKACYILVELNIRVIENLTPGHDREESADHPIQ